MAPAERKHDTKDMLLNTETLGRFPTLHVLVEAAAQKQHIANLCDGGVFDAQGHRTSDLAAERQVAAQRVVYHVGDGHNTFSNIPEEIRAWSIPLVGYAPVGPDDWARLRMMKVGQALGRVIPRAVLSTDDVADLLDLTIPDDGEAPALDPMVYAGDASSWIEDVIQAESAAYADDHGRGEPPDPEAAFKARQRLRSLHFALDLVKLIGTRT